jgi:hypothetical protein
MFFEEQNSAVLRENKSIVGTGLGRPVKIRISAARNQDMEQNGVALTPGKKVGTHDAEDFFRTILTAGSCEPADGSN